MNFGLVVRQPKSLKDPDLEYLAATRAAHCSRIVTPDIPSRALCTDKVNVCDIILVIHRELVLYLLCSLINLEGQVVSTLYILFHGLVHSKLCVASKNHAQKEKKRYQLRQPRPRDLFALDLRMCQGKRSKKERGRWRELGYEINTVATLK